jgi:prolyl-tRNA editing enzyme YbaK/EbsC (Cys-tRNA(Pro) deacylase)
MDLVVSTTVQMALKTLEIAYELVECQPDLADTALFSAHYGYPMTHCGNAIIVAGKSEPRLYAACVVQAAARLDVNRTVRTLLEVRRISFASPEETQSVTGMTIGGVTVFGLPEDMPIYLASDLKGLDYVILGSGTRRGKLKIDPSELTKLPNAVFVEGLSKPMGSYLNVDLKS